MFIKKIKDYSIAETVYTSYVGIGMRVIRTAADNVCLGTTVFLQDPIDYRRQMLRSDRTTSYYLSDRDDKRVLVRWDGDLRMEIPYNPLKIVYALEFGE